MMRRFANAALVLLAGCTTNTVYELPPAEGPEASDAGAPPQPGRVASFAAAAACAKPEAGSEAPEPEPDTIVIDTDGGIPFARIDRVWTCGLTVGGVVARYSAVYGGPVSVSTCAVVIEGEPHLRSRLILQDMPEMHCIVADWGFAVRDGMAFVAPPDGADPLWMDCDE